MDTVVPGIVGIADFEPYIGAQAVDRIARKAERLRGVTVANVNSTYYGGGVAEILSSETLLMNSLGRSGTSSSASRTPPSSTPSSAGRRSSCRSRCARVSA